jgi:Ulp1 family protease
MNLDKSNQPGSHWVAVYIDALKDKAIEYYDSYGRDPPKQFLKQLKALIEKIRPDTYLKLKINKVVDQRANSNTCGFHSIKFLLDRYANKPWKECTGWSNISKAEKDAYRMKKKYKKFGYI